MSRPRTDGFTEPSVARIYDFWLGGRDNFAVDRERACQIEAAYASPPGQVPPPRRNVRASRAFVERAVDYAARQGAGQFVHLGAGLPPPSHYPKLHDVARQVAPGARMAYIDGDPATVSLARVLTAGQDVAVIDAHLDEPESVLKLLGDVIDLGRPCCFILAMVLHLMDAERARAVTAAYAAAMAAGSFLVISCPHCDPPADDPGLWERIRAARKGCEAWNHSADAIESFFSGTEFVDPGLVLARAWKPLRGPVGMQPDSASYVLAGVGIKDLPMIPTPVRGSTRQGQARLGYARPDRSWRVLTLPHG